MLRYIYKCIYKMYMKYTPEIMSRFLKNKYSLRKYIF